MNIWFRDIEKIDQTYALLDYVERLDRFRAGRRAVQVHLSRLRPDHRREHHLRFAAACLNQIAKRYKGSLFWLPSNDMVVLTEGARIADIDEVIFRLRFLFSDDPLLAEAEGQFCTWYDLEHDYDALLVTARDLHARKQDEPPQPVGTNGLAGRRGQPLDPAHLAEIERSLANADLSNFLRRQPICRLTPNREPAPLFEELYFSIEDLRQALLPEYDIAADRWLFQHLTQVLDLRMLALLTGHDGAVPTRECGINLNLTTILAPEFLEFDARLLTAADRNRMIIELQPVDIFADIVNYHFAHDYLKVRDYRLCLDGIRHHALPLLDRERLGIDLIKVQWEPGLADAVAGDRGAALKDAVAQIGREQVVLCRCDSPLGAEVGAALGISLYQGRYVDTLLKAAAGREEHPPRRPPSRRGIS